MSIQQRIEMPPCYNCLRLGCIVRGDIVSVQCDCFEPITKLKGDEKMSWKCEVSGSKNDEYILQKDLDEFGLWEIMTGSLAGTICISVNDNSVDQKNLLVQLSGDRSGNLLAGTGVGGQRKLRRLPARTKITLTQE